MSRKGGFEIFRLSQIFFFFFCCCCCRSFHDKHLGDFRFISAYVSERRNTRDSRARDDDKVDAHVLPNKTFSRDSARDKGDYLEKQMIHHAATP